MVMKKLHFIILSLLLAACAMSRTAEIPAPTAAARLATGTLTPQLATMTPQPSVPRQTATLAETEATPAVTGLLLPYGLAMMDEFSGWAHADGPGDLFASRLLHTSDGGLTWVNVTPALGFSRYSETFYLDAR